MRKIAIDAMGGDFGPEPLVGGVVEALLEKNFLPYLVGDEVQIKSFLPNNLLNKVKIVHTTDYIKMEESATDVLKRKESSIFMAIELLKNGEVDAVVSAGHSGSTMTLATLKIGRFKGLARPALATLMPTVTEKNTLVLDVGANVDCTSEHLYQFAILGEAYAKEVLKIDAPKVGLLANGEEKSKGNEVTKQAFAKLSSRKTFYGNVEGNDIFYGTVDVVVCDGFEGNLVLKTAEGISSAIVKILKTSIKKSLIRTLGALLMKGAFSDLKKKMDYQEYGGAPLLGIKKCTIISHGKSDARAMKNAIFQALRYLDSDVEKSIENELAKMDK